MFQFRDLLAISKFWPVNGQDIDGDSNRDVDWTGDGTISLASVSVDINEDGKCVEPGPDDNPDTNPADDDVLLSDDIIHDGSDRQCDTPRIPCRMTNRRETSATLSPTSSLGMTIGAISCSIPWPSAIPPTHPPASFQSARSRRSAKSTRFSTGPTWGS
jgi:hypothetical protein